MGEGGRSGKLKGEFGAEVFGWGLELKGSPRILDDLTREVESNPGVIGQGFGGEEGFKDGFVVMRRDADAVV